MGGTLQEKTKETRPGSSAPMERMTASGTLPVLLCCPQLFRSSSAGASTCMHKCYAFMRAESTIALQVCCRNCAPQRQRLACCLQADTSYPGECPQQERLAAQQQVQQG